jgi:hypothetical protein
LGQHASDSILEALSHWTIAECLKISQFTLLGAPSRTRSLEI